MLNRNVKHSLAAATALLTLIGIVSAARTFSEKPQSQNSRGVLIRPAPAADQRIAYGKYESQFGELRLPKTAGLHPVAVVIHGGCWMSQYGLGYMGHVSAALTEAGVATWNIEYRRVGNAGGGWPGTAEDAARATDYLRQIAGKYSLDLNRVVAIGHSAGGHLALLLGARKQLPKDHPLYSANPLPLAGVVSLAGITDLRHTGTACDKEVAQLMSGEAKEKAASYNLASPIELLPLGVRQKIIQGGADNIIPMAMATEYIEAAKKKEDDAELIALKDADHFSLVDPKSAAWPTVQEAVLSLVKAKK
ncbi:MAG: alpha/beta hydrolase [Acidobacteriota bacterium]|nr:alpha/beta hydrolase [Acidobacteriota bacterium]